MTQSQGKISKQLVTTWATGPLLLPGRAVGPSPLMGSSWGAGPGGGWGWVSSPAPVLGLLGSLWSPMEGVETGFPTTVIAAGGSRRGQHGVRLSFPPTQPRSGSPWGYLNAEEDSIAMEGEAGGGQRREEEAGRPWIAMGWVHLTAQS